MRQGLNKFSALRSALVLASAGVVFVPEAFAGKLDRPYIPVDVRIKTGEGSSQTYTVEKDEQSRSWKERIQAAQENALRATQKTLAEEEAAAAKSRAAAAARVAARAAAVANPANPSASPDANSASSAPVASPAAAAPVSDVTPKQPYSVSQHEETLHTQAPKLLTQPPPPSSTTDAEVPAPKPRHINVDGVDLPFGLSEFADETDEKLFPKGTPRRPKQKSLHSRSTGKFDADGKAITEDIDPHSTLRNFNKIAKELGERRSNKNTQWQKGGLAELNGENRLPANSSWSSQVEAWNRTGPSRIEMRPSFEGDIRDMKRHEIPERENRYTGASRFAGKYASQLQKLSAANDFSLDPGYGANRTAPIAERRYAGLAVNNLSMQDVNRYQFRRSHTTTPGMPVVSPGGGDVDTSRFRPQKP
jgi:hypothetical protein